MNLTENREDIKTPVKSFSSGPIYIGLNLTSKYDEKTGTHTAPIPRLTPKFGNEFIDLPMKGKWWNEFADFTNDMTKILEGVDIESASTSGDAETRKQLMAQFKSS